MEDIFKIFIVSFIQGLTELFPISSSAHIMVAESLMGSISIPGIANILHLGSTLALIICYRKTLLAQLKSISCYKSIPKLSKNIVIALIPIMAFGFLYKKVLCYPVVGTNSIAIALAVGGVIFILVEKWSSKRNFKIASLDEISYKDAAILGLAQIFAIFPGVSRLGITLLAGRLLGFKGDINVAFSFLMAIPAMAIASTIDLLSASQQPNMHVTGMIFGIITTCLFTLVFFLPCTRYLAQPKSLTFFGYYRLAAALVLYMVGNI